ncbi:PLP-dependent aminotransferase family protein [Staphylococcus sp. SQ8-PEA]|uniref:PLP-dependent aminotransferase family protein n=1 Tax=Staphylococcus marylandisciuri TaxID=2981529 RepID=A0ABT2QRX2_9STAP|nr:PLP-dependent aminotransferase family protein [Staphylococcus marylandisciuri]MCU5746708.1 PLP-dependent aminotransferase family protein [Staphylococcus marylandisciuri]
MTPQPLYFKLYEQLKQQIIEGHYQSGDKFPSKRVLQQHLTVSNTTIEHAYQYLIDEGYIYSKPRSGFYVSDIESLPAIPSKSFPYEDEFQVKDEELATSKHFKYQFNLSEIDTDYFPLSQFRKQARDVFEDHHLDLLHHGDPQGEWALRQQISHYIFNSRGVTSHPNQIVIGSSTEQLINILTTILSQSKFIIEKPSYPPIKKVLDNKNIDYLQNTVTSTGMTMDNLQTSSHNIVYVTPSHQFPTGHVMNLKKRTKLIQWAQSKKERYIIEDDYDSEFRYFGKPISALQSLDTKDKVIYISTFSKSLFPSCRIAYMTLPADLLKRYHAVKNKGANTVPVHLQHIVAQFMQGGSFERHLNKMRKVYREKLTFILSEIKPYRDQLIVDGTLTGMHFTLTVNNGLSLEECLKRANAHQLKIIPFKQYDHRETKPKFIIGYGGIPFGELKEHTQALIKTLIRS